MVYCVSFIVCGRQTEPNYVLVFTEEWKARPWPCNFTSILGAFRDCSCRELQTSGPISDSWSKWNSLTYWHQRPLQNRQPPGQTSQTRILFCDYRFLLSWKGDGMWEPLRPVQCAHLPTSPYKLSADLWCHWNCLFITMGMAHDPAAHCHLQDKGGRLAHHPDMQMVPHYWH